MYFLENFCQVIFILSETYFGRLNIYSYQIIKLAPLSQYSNSSKIWFIMVKVWWKSLFLTRNFAPFLKRCTDIKYIIRSRFIYILQIVFFCPTSLIFWTFVCWWNCWSWKISWWFIKFEMMSMGTGKTMVLLCSAEILLRVWRYLNWNRKYTKIYCILISLKIFSPGERPDSPW